MNVPALRLGAIILAAGASTRMGRPKALLEWRGATFLEHAADRAICAGSHPVIVVTGASALTPPKGTTGVPNDAWRLGQLSSLQVGIQCLLRMAPQTAGCLVLTVDRPALAQHSVDALVSAWRGDPEGLWQPRHDRRSGHPILYPQDLLRRLLTLDAAADARELVRSEAVAARRRAIEVDDPGVTQNIDTPEDLSRLGT